LHGKLNKNQLCKHFLLSLRRILFKKEMKTLSSLHNIPVNSAVLKELIANHLYGASYISLETALS